MERRRALLQLQQQGAGRGKDRPRGGAPQGAALALCGAAALLLVLVLLGVSGSGLFLGAAGSAKSDAPVASARVASMKAVPTAAAVPPLVVPVEADDMAQSGGIFSWLLITAATGALAAAVFLRSGGGSLFQQQQQQQLPSGAASYAYAEPVTQQQQGGVNPLRVDVRAIANDQAGRNRLNYVPTKLGLRALGGGDEGEGTASAAGGGAGTPGASSSSPMALGGGSGTPSALSARAGAAGNAWSNARSLLDFSAAISPSSGQAPSVGYYASQLGSQGSDSFLSTPGRGVSPTAVTGSAVNVMNNNMNMSVDASSMTAFQGFGVLGSTPQIQILSPAGTPISPAASRQQMAGSGSRMRYKASPSEPSPSATGTCRGGYARSTTGVSPLAATALSSRLTASAPVVDCLRYLDIDYLNDQYIINLRGVLGTYLQDCMQRFDAAVSGIVAQLVSRGKLPPTHAAMVSSLLSHVRDKEPSPLIGGQGPAEFTLSDVLKFCGQPDVRPLLVVPSKGASSIDLNTEYNQAVCLFRVAGDRFTSSSSSSSGSSIGAAPAGSGSGAAGGSAGANEDEDGLADFGVSRKVFSRAVLARGVLRGSRAGLLDGSSAMAGGKADVTSKPVSSSSTSSSASSSSSSSLLLMAEGDTHRCTSYIISRCRELATDNHFGNYKWQAQSSASAGGAGAGQVSRRSSLPAWAVSDAEVVAAVFLHFCDASFSPLAVSDDHRFSSARFFDATAGTPVKLPPGKAEVCLIRKSFSPTHFAVVVADPRSHVLTELAVEAGRQNVFEAILLFLLVLQKHLQQHHGSDTIALTKTTSSSSATTTTSAPGAAIPGSGPGSVSAAHVRGVLEDVFGTADPLQRLLLHGHHYQDDLYRR